MRYKELIENLTESVLAQSRIHRNTTISTLKALAKNAKSKCARFVIRDGLHAADADEFTHYDVWPPQQGVRGWVYCEDDGSYTYEAFGFFDMWSKDDPLLRKFEAAGIRPRPPRTRSVTENVDAGKNLVAMLRRKDAYVSEFEDDGFESEEEASCRFDELYELFDGLPNPMPVYRGMAVTSGWLNAVVQGENPQLGVHWTYDRDAARSDLAGHSHTNYADPAKRKTMTEVVICGLVAKDAVDWEWTFSKNLPYPDEAEVHIRDATVRVQSVIVQGKTIKIGRMMPTGGIEIGNTPVVENAGVGMQSFVELAKRHDTVEKFIRATDGMDVLYRGHYDDATGDNSFMTDWVGHASEYAGDEGRVDAFAFDPRDVLFYNDARFDEMRNVYCRLSDQQLANTYRDSLRGNRFAEQHHGAFSVVEEILHGDTPYSEICGDPEKNDALVPLLQKYARDAHGKNIIAFHGNDYASFGGQTEYVVADISKLTDLRKLYASVRGQPLVEDADVTAWAKRKHEEMLASYAKDGWSYGPEVNEENKTAPFLIPWEDLPEKRRKQYGYRQWAAEYQGIIYDAHEPQGGKASEWTWSRVTDFPVANLTNLLPEGAWEGWMRREIMDHDRGYYDGLMDGSPIREEIVVVHGDDGQWGIWDGWHRVGASFLMNPQRTTLPALVGTNRRRRNR